MLNEDIKNSSDIEEQIRSFIKDCEQYDLPRLEREVFPDGVRLLDCVRYECLRPEPVDPANKDKCFILIHGGAFVYGFKELDRCFGMHLAKLSGMSVININYTLMPDITLTDLLYQISGIIEEAGSLFGYTTFHLTGDSAGAYLAYAVSLAARNMDIRFGFGLEEMPNLNIESCGLICGCYTLSRDGFPGILFEKGDGRLMPFAYDLGLAGVKDKTLRTAILTGDKDFLRQDNKDLAARLKEEGCPVSILDLESDEEHEMQHVFPITDPASPQAREVLRLIAENAKGSFTPQG